MPSTYTERLRFTRQGSNENPNTWGEILNKQVINLIDEAIAGVANIDVTGSSNVDLSNTTVTGGQDDARNAVLKLSGNISQNIDVIVPSVEKTYIVHALQTGGSINFRPAGGNGVVLGNEEIVIVYCDGSNIFRVTAPPVNLPVGLITMWSGSINTIPTGWQLCDGTNGSPDLRDKFVVGARQDDGGVAKTNITGSLRETGGSLQGTLQGETEEAGGHDHGGSTAGHRLTIAQIPSHTHDVTYDNTKNDSRSGNDRRFIGDDSGGYSRQSTSTGGDEEHSHNLSEDGAHTHSLDGVEANINPPPFYALAYIMYRGE